VSAMQEFDGEVRVVLMGFPWPGKTLWVSALIDKHGDPHVRRVIDNDRRRPFVLRMDDFSSSERVGICEAVRDAAKRERAEVQA